MTGYIEIGKRYTDWNSVNVGGQNLEYLKPKQLFLDLIKYKTMPVEWDLKNIVLVGSQGSGKTVLIRYLVYLIRNNPDWNPEMVSVLRTNDLRIVGDRRYKKYFENKKVIVIIKDDAISEGTDSRRAMSGHNVETTQQFCVTRHILEENYEPNGVIFFIFASQIYSRLDPTIRDTAQIRIFTEFYDKKWFFELFTPEDRELIRVATYEGMVGSNFDARRFAIARTKTGDTVTLEIPYSYKAQVPYPNIDRAVKKSSIIDYMAKLLIEEFQDFDETSRGQMKGFLGLKAEEIQKDYYVKLSKSDFTSAIDRADYYRIRFLSPQDFEALGVTGITPEKKTLKERISNMLESKKMVRIDDVVNFLGVDRKVISNTLNSYTSTFENLWKGKGLYCLKKYRKSISQAEIESILEIEETKKLVM